MKRQNVCLHSPLIDILKDDQIAIGTAVKKTIQALQIR